jgi:CRISPR-associated protein Cmr4
MSTRLVFVHALSPLHAGTGQGVGVIDLPIAREKATGIPYLPGSSLKGTLRDLCPGTTDDEKKKKWAVFGPETADAAEHAGSAQFSDQRLLLLPVRTLKGTFAWVTSPYLLQRFIRETLSAELPESLPPSNVPPPATNRCLVGGKDSALLQKQGDKLKVILEDLDLDASENGAVAQWADWLGNRIFRRNNQTWRDYFKTHLCVVSDDVLTFLLDTATEITARIKLIPDKKTVQKGGLWYEEALPAETLLSGLLVATKVRVEKEDDVFDVVRHTLTRHPTVQLGGKATVGRGLCCVHLADPQGAKK